MFGQWPSDALGILDECAALDVNLTAWRLLREDELEARGTEPLF
jgi:hypothetical protein